MAETWHEQHRSDYSAGQRIADGTAKILGSWPVIMMSQNRAADRDRYQAQADYETNVKAEQLTEELLERLNGLEARLDRVLACVAATEIETTEEDA